MFRTPQEINMKLATLIFEMDKLEHEFPGELIIGDISIEISKNNEQFRKYVMSI